MPKKISGNRAAKQLGIPKTTFFRKLDEFNSTVMVKKSSSDGDKDEEKSNFF